jgi:NADH dehydrogenase
LKVDDRLRLEGQEGVFAIGDLAGAQGGDEQELPMLSSPALQEGRYAARAIMHLIQTGDPPARPFRYLDKGTMATIGRNAGIAQFAGGIQLTGFLGWMAWSLVHVYYLVGFRNRILALATWAWNYLRFDRPIRIILESDRDPMVDLPDPRDASASADKAPSEHRGAG